MHRRFLLIVLAAVPLAACEVLMNQDYQAPASVSVQTPAASSMTASEPDDAAVPLEPGDVPTGTGARQQTTATDAGYADDERVLENGMVELGNASAPFSMTAYINHSCAYCRTFTNEYLPKLLAGFVRRGEVKLRLVALPFTKYPNSRAESAGLLCAARQGEGLAMHRALLALQTRTEASVRTAALDLGIDAAAFDTCIADPATAGVLASQEEMAKGSGATLVPAFAFDPPAEMVLGLLEYPDMRGKIEEALSR